MKKKKTLIIGIILVLIGLLIISTAINIKIGRVNNNKETKEIKKEEKLYKLNDDGTIYFKDKNLEKAIKEETKLNTLTPESVKDIELLWIENKNIKSLEGLEFFQNLLYLNLDDNYISNAYNLRQLKNLKGLQLNNNMLKSAEDFKYLKNLESLSIASNLIEDVSPLKELKKLSSLPGTENNVVLNLDILEENLKIYEDNLYNTEYVEVMKNVDTGEIEIIKDFSDQVLANCNKTYVECIRENAVNTQRKEIETYKKAIKVAKDFIKKNIKDNMSDIEKEAIISNYIVDTIYYERTDSGEDGTNVQDGTHTYYHTLVLHHGQCHDYAQIFNLLAKLSGLESYSAFNGPEHEWNVVKIDNQFYHVDLTWEDSVYDGTYINVSTNSINERHYGLSGEFTPYHETENLDLTKDMDIEIVRKYFYPDQKFE